jgi:signal transduction histidine kinase
MSINYLLYNKAVQGTKGAIEAVRQIAAHESQITPHALLHSIERDHIRVQIISSQGTLLDGSRGLNHKILTPVYLGPPVLSKFQGRRIFRTGVNLEAHSLQIQIIRPLNPEEDFIKSFMIAFGLVGFIGLILSIFGGSLVTRAALKPLHQLNQTAQTINASDLSSRISLNGPADELYSLTQSFNQMLDRLEQGFHSQREFLNAASHDLRTPLAIIKSYSDILSRWGKDDPEVIREAAPAIVRAVEVMERLVGDLLLLAKVQARNAFQITTLSLNGLAAEIGREAQSLTHVLKVSVKTSEPVTVEADQVYLRRAIWILVDNAMKYNLPGGTVTIQVSKNDSDEAVLQVTDTGFGIEKEEIPKIFDRFYRGDCSRSHGKGFGLGLALAKEIFEAHRGRIEVESQPGQGSTFRVILPIHSI